MCGIVGLLAPGSRTLRDDVDRMSARVAHRGPDDHGVWHDPDAGVALGHRRLAVVDLSPSGHQPMTSADGRWVLVFNGEVYDHADHRRFLQGRGVELRGHSDTEVLLELAALVGLEAALKRVDGMFALGLWDRRERRLVLARDALGEKPLYYGRVGGGFAFASELTALRRLPGATSALDPAAVAEFLRLGFVPAPLSILSGVAKLPAGCTLGVRPDGSPDDPTPYWSLHAVAEAGLADPLTLGDEDLVDLADATLRTSLAGRLLADVPVGAFLSGGLDSSTITALAAQVSPHRLRTFTVAVGGSGDESDAAASVAAHLGTDHTTLELPESDALAMASRVPGLYDEPFADPSAIPTALLCAAARRHVTVALSGDGADELLAGYHRYRVAQGGMAALFGLPAPLRRGLGAALRVPSPAAWDRVGSLLPGGAPALGTKAHKLAGALAADGVLGAYDLLAGVWEPGRVLVAGAGGSPSAAAASGAGASGGAASLFAHPPLAGGTPLDRMLLADQSRTLPDNMLVKVDRASMAVALEARVPFLDRRFVELTWRLPARAKVRDGRGKWLVRQVLDRYVPRELVDRPKTGFDPPLADWLRGPLREWSHDLLAPERLRRQGWLRPEPIAEVLASHDAGRRNHDYALWTVLMFSAWLDETGE